MLTMDKVRKPSNSVYSLKPRLEPECSAEKEIEQKLITWAYIIQQWTTVKNNTQINYTKFWSSRTLLYFFLICIVGSGTKVHSTLRPLNGLLCHPRVIMITEKSVKWLARETEVLGENLPQYHFVHHKPHMLPVREPGPPRWEASV
jgi:hypothetical protein